MSKEEKILNVVKDCLKRRSGTTTVVITIREDGSADVKATSEYEGCFDGDDEADAEPVKVKEAKEDKEDEIPSFDVNMDDVDEDDVDIDPDAAVPALKDLLGD